jgi:hypothetical protein
MHSIEIRIKFSYDCSHMWQEQKQTSTSPFDCVVCGTCVYLNNSGIRICLPCKSFFRRHVLLPPNVSRT